MGYGEQFTNTDFKPPIPFEPKFSDHIFTLNVETLTLLSVNTTQFQKQTADIPFSLEIADGNLLLSSLKAVDKPQFFDINIHAQLQEKDCIVPLRISLLPARKMLGGIEYEVSQVIGRRGGDIGTLTLPYGTDFNQQTGALIVSDCGNEIIQVFDTNGTFKRAFGKSEKSQIARPADVKYRDNKYFVVEETTNSVTIFDQQGAFLSKIEGDVANLNDRSKPGVLHIPLGIALTARNDLVVVEQANNRLSVFDETGKFKRVVENSENDPLPFVAPYYIDIDPTSGMIAVTNRGAHEVLLLDGNGNKIRSLGKGILNYPHELTFDNHGGILVADYLNRRLVRFNQDESVDFINLQPSWGRPKTVAVNEEGLIAIAFASSEAFIILISSEQSPAKLSKQINRELKLDFRWGKFIEETKAYGAWDLSPPEIYSRYCSSCHNGGHPEAPLPGVLASWQKFSRDLDVLLDNALSGNNVMLRKGGCYDCTEDQIMETITYMLPQDFLDTSPAK